MRTRLLLTGLLLSLLFGLSACTKRVTLMPQKPKILVVTGGHPFDEKEFFEMFDSFSGITYDRAVLPQDMDLLSPGLEKKYDAVVSYDMNHFHGKPQNEPRITDAQRANFGKLMQTGMPLLILHHSVGGYPKWPPYRDMAGGAYIYSGAVFLYDDLDGKSWPASESEHDIDMNIMIADKDHPITLGLDDFTIHDEIYIGMYVNPKVHVLLTTDDPRATKEIAWVHHYGNSPVFTLVLGHDKQSYANENLRKLLVRGIDWLVNEKKNIVETQQ